MSMDRKLQAVAANSRLGANRPITPLLKLSRTTGVVAATLALAGCSLAGAPSYSIFGAFFPAWLLCAGIGVAGAICLRRIAIGTGLEPKMPFKPLVYIAFAAALALSTWMLLFGTS
jgi:hypothetical protein